MRCDYVRVFGADQTDGPCIALCSQCIVKIFRVSETPYENDSLSVVSKQPYYNKIRASCLDASLLEKLALVLQLALYQLHNLADNRVKEFLHLRP